MRLRANLIALVLGALLPLLALAVFGAALFVQRERATIERDAIGRVRAAMTAIDAELRGTVSSLQVLAASRHVAAADWQSFREEARAVLTSQPGWLNVTLYDENGARVADAVLDASATPSSPAAEPAAIRESLRTGAFVVGDVATGAVVPVAAVRVYLPVRVGQRMSYVVSAALRPERFAQALTAQRLPPTWVIALADRQRRFVARMPPRPAGSPVSESFRDAIAAAPEGFFRGRTTEGLESFTPYVTSSVSGWVLGIAMPVAVVTAGARELTGLLVAGVVLALGGGVVLAWLVARRVTAPIEALVDATATLGQPNHAVRSDGSGIDELGRLGQAMRAAHDAMVDRERLLGRERDALRAADKAKDEFIAMLSHELRNPLAAMTSASQVLKLADPAGPQASRAREIVARQARHMSRLIEDLLDMNRILMGKIQLSREPLNLAEVARTLAAVWREGSRLGNRSVEIAAVDAWIDADRARIEQVLSNLLSNAVKFSRDGTPLGIVVACDGGEASLTVRDQGEGFATDALGWMFELFAQGAQSIDRAKGGLGVGLAVVKRLVEMHGGRVEAHSDGLAKGASFRIVLPAIAPPAAKAAAAAPAPRAVARRVLVIEDNQDVSETLKSVLSLAGHDVRTAADGLSGLAAALADRPDAALVDIGLPDIDGYEVVRRLRREAPDARIRMIALTGYGQSEDRRRALEAGFDMHLTKPVDPAELNSVLASPGTPTSG